MNHPFPDVLKEPEKLDYTTRLAEDGYMTVQEQVQRFIAAGAELKHPSQFDEPFDQESNPEFNPLPVYGADPVEVAQELEVRGKYFDEKVSQAQQAEQAAAVTETVSESKTE